jgi:nitric oxide reductase large subunit
MALGIVLIVVAAVLLIFAVMCAMEKGPLWTLTYFSASEKEREELKTRENYRLSALICGGAGIAFLVVACVLLFR